MTHLIGEARCRELAAGWDTLPLHGETLFAAAGPAMQDDAAVSGGLQDRWEDVFLPPVASVERAA